MPLIGTAARRSPKGTVAIADVEGAGDVQLPLRLAEQFGDGERLERRAGEIPVSDEPLGIGPARIVSVAMVLPLSAGGGEAREQQARRGRRGSAERLRLGSVPTELSPRPTACTL